MFDDIRQFLRENPRFPLILGVAFLATVVVAWGVWGGFSLEIGRFFALERDRQADGGPVEGLPGDGSVPMQSQPVTPVSGTNPSASSASCGSLGGTVCDTRSLGRCRNGYTDVGTKTTDCDSGYGYCCKVTTAAGTGPFVGSKPTPTELRAYAQAQGWSEDFARFSDAVLQSWIDSSWNISGRKFNSKRAGVTGLWEKPTECPAGQVPAGPSESDPCVTPSGGATPVPTAAATPVPTATATTTQPPTTITPAPPPPPSGPIVCSPPAQSVAVGQTASFRATGGTGIYQWNGGAGGVQEDDDGLPGSAAFLWLTSGQKTVIVTSGTSVAYCSVAVQRDEAAPAPTPTQQSGPVGMAKEARNLSVGQTAGREAVEVRDGNRVQFIVRLFDREGDGTGEMFVRDEVPPGMSYVSGSTTVDGAAVFDGIVTGGITLAPLAAERQHEVRWSALADRVGELPLGPQTVTPEATVESSEDGQLFTQSDPVTVTVYGTATGFAGGAGFVPVGPSGAVMLALIFAAISSLLYAAHTRSPGFRRREVDRISKDQGPLDFRA